MDVLQLLTIDPLHPLLFFVPILNQRIPIQTHRSYPWPTTKMTPSIEWRTWKVIRVELGVCVGGSSVELSSHDF